MDYFVQNPPQEEEVDVDAALEEMADPGVSKQTMDYQVRPLFKLYCMHFGAVYDDVVNELSPFSLTNVHLPQRKRLQLVSISSVTFIRIPLVVEEWALI